MDDLGSDEFISEEMDKNDNAFEGSFGRVILIAYLFFCTFIVGLVALTRH